MGWDPTEDPLFLSGFARVWLAVREHACAVGTDGFGCYFARLLESALFRVAARQCRYRHEVFALGLALDEDGKS